MSKRKKASAFHSPKRIEFIAEQELVDDVKRLLALNGLTLSHYLRYSLRRVPILASQLTKDHLLSFLEEAPNDTRGT